MITHSICAALLATFGLSGGATIASGRAIVDHPLTAGAPATSTGIVVANSKPSKALSPDSTPVSIVLVPGELPGGALVIVQRKAPGNPRTYIVLSKLHLSDSLIMRANGVMAAYAYRHSEDKGHVEFALFPDGRLETRSDLRGLEVGTHVPVLEHSSGRNQMTADLLAEAATVRESNVPGFGPAWVIDLPGLQR